ncbi:MAG: hypothetical protein J2P49_03600 [Methylocapsa sp.]|nr:hypothetical protein [Methylocapsa sp.]
MRKRSEAASGRGKQSAAGRFFLGACAGVRMLIGVDRIFGATRAQQWPVIFVTCVLASGAGGLFAAARALEVPIAKAPPAQSFAVWAAFAETQVEIVNMQPASGPPGTAVTLTGFGFTHDNSIYFGTGVIAHVPINSAIGIACATVPNCRGGIQQTIVFAAPDTLPAACPAESAGCPSEPRPTVPGVYPVSVGNENGRTNEVWFTVTGGGTAAPGSR